MERGVYTDCTACGSANPPGSEFCGECGAPLEAVSAPPPPPQPEEPVLEVSEQLVEPLVEELRPLPPKELPLAEDQQPLSWSPPLPEDVVYYEGDGVRVTRTQAILGDQTYEIAQVTSVSLESKPARRMAGIVTAIIGFSVMSGCLFSGESLAIKLVVVLGGLVALALGVVLVALEKSEHTVRIVRASGEVGVFASNDPDHAEQIVRAMHRGIAVRS
ncbi:DUF6232 family protein [Chloroflexota bacterium]